MKNVSIAPDGKEYVMPTAEESAAERELLIKITEEQRKLAARSWPCRVWALWAA